MNAIYEQFDQALDRILEGEAVAGDEFDPMIQELLPIAQELKLMPRASFRLNLLAELENPSVVAGRRAQERAAAALFQNGYGLYPVRSSNFLASGAMHAMALLVAIFASVWAVQPKSVHPLQSVSLVSDVSPYLPSPSMTTSGGGGGGGDHDKLLPSQGDAPRFAHEQLTPPAIVVRNSDPKLVAEPTVIGPPSITLTKLGSTGDPLTDILNSPSNGTGVGGGIGTGSGGGVGSGYGSGVGPGYGGGIGGGVYRVGNGVSAPRAIYDPEPAYSEEARNAKVQGVVVLSTIIGADGRPRDLKISRALGMGLDDKALEAVRNWRFAPATRDGRPVAVQVYVEVNFHLY
jgi:periplasmic protein TonB